MPVTQGENNRISLNQQNTGNRTSWASLFPVNGLDLSTAQNEVNTDSNVKITYDDIQLEVEYWSSSVLCHVLDS